MTATLPETLVETDSGPKIDPQEAFYSKFMQLDFEVHRPSFAVQLTKQRVARFGLDVKTQISDRDVGVEVQERVRNQLDLITEPQRKILNAAYGKAEKFVKDPALTCESPIRGLRMLPLSRKAAFFDNWPTVLKRWEVDLEKFFEIYEVDVVARCHEIIKPKVGEDLFKEIARVHLPPLERLRAKFSMRIVIGQFNYQEAEDARNAIETMANTVRDNLTKALGDLSLRLADGSVLTDATLNNIARALEGMRSFAAIGDAALNTEVDKMSKMVKKISAECVQSKNVGLSMTSVVKGYNSTLNSAIASVSKAAQNQAGIHEVMTRYGAMPRRLGRLDDSEN